MERVKHEWQISGYYRLSGVRAVRYNRRGDALMKWFVSVFGGLSDEAFCLLSGSLKVGCAMLICSLALLVHTGGLHADTYALYFLAAQLESNAAGVVLAGNFAALFLEALRRR